MRARTQLVGLTLMLPPGWLDITHELPEGSPPTFAKEDGVGVIQVSVAKYNSGLRPRIDKRAVREILEEFGAKHDLGAPRETTQGNGQEGNQFVAGDFLRSDERISAWFVTNGKDMALVTYVTREPNDPAVPQELDDASAVVAALEFE